MAVPNFQRFMLPLLKVGSDGRPHRLREAADAVARDLRVGESDRSELLPSGTQSRFDNRLAWARSHLTHAGLLEAPARGFFQITERGVEVLARNPIEITMRDLQEFEEYVEFRRGRTSDGDQDSEQTPRELLEAGHQTLRTELAQALLERVRSAPAEFFEVLVVRLLVKMGYGGSQQETAEALTPRSGDEGIDGIIKEDPLGLDVVYVQAKRWESSVGRPVLQEFAGSLEGKRAQKGVFMTTSRFTSDATDYVSRIGKRIVLVDGERLADLMIEHGVGVNVDQVYTVKTIDEAFFEVDAAGEVSV